LQNATYKADFKRIADEVEKTYNLTPWAAGLSELLECEASLNVEKTFEKSVLSKVNNIDTQDGLRNFLAVELISIERMAEHFWSREGEVIAWQALRLASQIIRNADNCIRELETVSSPGSLVTMYTEKWWRIDRDYRNYRAKYDGDNRLSKLSSQIASIYRGFLSQLNEKFLSTIESQGAFAIEGVKEQSSFWSSCVSPSRKKRAVLLVDALRFELACDLKERVEESVRDAEVKCTPLVASPPTLTPIGMASLIAGDQTAAEVTSDGSWNVNCTRKGESGNLSLKEERKKVLRRRHSKVAFYDLEDVLTPSELIIGEANPIVVFTREMDGLGHESGALNFSLDFLGQYLEGLVRAIRRLGSIGVEEIHIISDHGFLMVDEVTDADKVTIPKTIELLYTGHRCLIGTKLPKELGAVFDVPNSDNLQFCVPRGIGIFRARGGKQFFHGGLSVQEVIISHLELIFAKAELKYGVKIKAPEAIHNLIFEVELLRSIPADGVLFGAPRFVEIVGTLDKDKKQIFSQSGPDMVIDQGNETVQVRLRIRPGIAFSYGDVLCIEAKDADTSELLDGAEIRIEVESNE